MNTYLSAYDLYYVDIKYHGQRARFSRTKSKVGFLVRDESIIIYLLSVWYFWVDYFFHHLVFETNRIIYCRHTYRKWYYIYKYK